MSDKKGVIGASFAKDSGYGNSVFSKVAVARNTDFIT